MDPEEWEREADQVAAQLHSRIDDLEGTLSPEPAISDVQGFWPRVKQLNEALRTAPAIKLEDKLAVQRRLNELCHRARRQQRRLAETRKAQERELRDAIGAANEGLAAATTIEELHEIRADVALLRRRITETPKVVAQRVWPAWQAVNQRAWEKLNAEWASNEGQLRAALDEADAALERGDVRSAKEAIKRFHAEVPRRECSHGALKVLRSRATSLWERGNALGQQKHTRYLEQAARRVTYWRQQRERQQRAREAIEREILRLEAQMAAAGTDVGAALVRGQLESRRKALADLEAQERGLDERIAATTATLEGSE